MTSRRLALPLAALLAVLAGCSGDDSTPASTSSTSTACVPGQQIACACPGGESGVQTCVDDGSAYAPCTACSGTGGDGTGAGGGGGAAEGGGGSTTCTPGANEPCYSGPPGTAGVGACVLGMHTCAADGASFGPCVGEIVPKPELCATPGDDDCDGQVNEGGADCSCAPGSQASCYSGPAGTEGVGLCHSGTQQCNATGTGYGPCVGEAVPAAETCATPDDEDCDGQVNEEGAQCVCLPNSTTACYDGPAGTENVGACKGGMKTCNATGTAYGACVGEVLPSTDFCVTLTDDDCDGSPMPCVDNPTWSLSYGQPGASDYVQRAVPDAVGNVVVLAAGLPIDVGNGPWYGGALLKLDPLGSVLWTKDLSNAAGTDVTVDGAGNITLVGGYSGAMVDFGGGPLPGPGGDYIVKFDAGGGHLWSKTFSNGGPGAAYNAVAVDPSGNIVLGGTLNGCVDFGAGSVCSQATQGDLLVVKLTAAGSSVWTKTGGAATVAGVTGVACDAQGNIALGGRFYPSIDLGSGALTASGGAAGLVAVLSPSGAPVFAKTIGKSNGTVQPVFDGLGGLLLAGDNQNTGVIDLGGGPVTPAQPNMGNDIWVGKLDAMTGAHLWSAGLGNGLIQQYGRIATDGAGNLLVTGFFEGLVSMGGQFLQSYGNEDIFLATYDASGAGISGQHFGDASPSQFGATIAVDVFGARILGGYFFGTIDLGSGVMTSQGSWDAFVAKLPP